MSGEPAPPSSAPSYAVNPLKRQDPETLRKLSDYCIELAVEKEKQEHEEVPEDLDEELAEQLEESGGPVFQQEKVRCGKDCGGCPHGPYWYKYYRENGKIISEYIGKERK